MSDRVTLTQKANGRFYIGLSKRDFSTVRASLDYAAFQARQQGTHLTAEALGRITKTLNKPARGSR